MYDRNLIILISTTKDNRSVSKEVWKKVKL